MGFGQQRDSTSTTKPETFCDFSKLLQRVELMATIASNLQATRNSKICRSLRTLAKAEALFTAKW